MKEEAHDYRIGKPCHICHREWGIKGEDFSICSACGVGIEKYEQAVDTYRDAAAKRAVLGVLDEIEQSTRVKEDGSFNIYKVMVQLASSRMKEIRNRYQPDSTKGGE